MIHLLTRIAALSLIKLLTIAYIFLMASRGVSSSSIPLSWPKSDNSYQSRNLVILINQT